MKLECSVEELKLLVKNFELKKEESVQKENVNSTKCANPYITAY